jgi:excisionase family DNA binding protein
MKGHQMTRQLHDVDETSEIINVGPAKVREEIKAGRLEARRVGKRILLTPEAIRAWIDALPRVAA